MGAPLELAFGERSVMDMQVFGATMEISCLLDVSSWAAIICERFLQ